MASLRQAALNVSWASARDAHAATKGKAV